MSGHACKGAADGGGGGVFGFHVLGERELVVKQTKESRAAFDQSDVYGQGDGRGRDPKEKGAHGRKLAGKQVIGAGKLLTAVQGVTVEKIAIRLRDNGAGHMSAPHQNLDGVGVTVRE